MTYTPEQLREWASNYEATSGTSNAIPKQLRAHADALDKLAKQDALLRECVEALQGTRFMLEGYAMTAADNDQMRHVQSLLAKLREVKP
jgi:hypothetical protein